MLDSDFQEAYTSVLDINTSEVYTQQASLPTSSLPYSGSSQNLQFITSGSGGSEVNIAQFWYKLELSPSDTITSGKYLTWFALSGSVSDVGYFSASSAQVIQANQGTSWISNKYAQPSLAGNKTEDSTPGYNVTITKGTDAASSTRVADTAWVFDYKTGVLQFIDETAAPTDSGPSGNRMFFSGYQYVGQTLNQFVASGSGGSGAGFPFSGSALITGSLVVSGSTILTADGATGANFEVEVPMTASNITASGNIHVTEITASDALFDSASIDYLTVNVLISGSTITTSGSNTFGDGMEDVQTLIGTTRMTGSANVTGSFEVSGSTLLSGSTNIEGVLSLQGIADVSASIAAAGGTAGIFTETGSFFATTNALQITGSTLQNSPLTATGQNITSSNDGTGGVAKYDVVTSHSMWNYNHNVGVPKSNAWKYNLNGSHFDNFDQNTDVSEILRFVAGLLSSSAPGAAPNTRTYGAISQFAEQNGTAGSKPAGIVPNDFNDPTITYLDGKGFVNIGDQLFYNISASLKSNIGRSRTFESDPAGSTTVSSSVTPGGDLFGLGLIGLEVSLSSSASFRFVDNMDDTNTFISASQGSISQTGTGGGIIKIGNLITANPAVIPNTFQDGLVEEAFSTPLNFINTIPLNESGSTGYYFTTQSIALKTGSSALTSFKENKEVVFLITGSLNGKLNTQTLVLGNQASSSISATSRSLSGAPYLRTANYINKTHIEGAFNPLYVPGTATIGSFTNSSDSKISDSNPTNNVRTGQINSTNKVGTANFIFDSSGTTARTIGNVPDTSDIIILSASYAFNAGTTGGDNISTNGQGLQTGNGNAQFQVTGTGLDRNNSSDTIVYTQPYHEAGTLGQPTDSGSLAYFGFVQGNNGGAIGNIASQNSEVQENFQSETYRASLTDVALSASYSEMGKIATGSFATYNLGAKDLQVKPGFLVYPGDATYGYWLEDPDDSETFKYYLRSYTKTFNGSAGSLKFRLRNTTNSANVALNAWSNTSDDGIAALVLVQNRGLGGTSFIANPGSGTSEFNGKASWVDMSDANGAFTAKTNFTAGTLGTNPFGVDITVSGMGAQGSSVSSGLSTMVCLANQFTTIPNSDPGIMVLVRYKGTPIAPISRIGVELT